ncbi:FtsX-like permease family protein [Streptomyces sp. NPDC001843]|uniref:FtsX-like permease family protein n=1 Tax=Streptomyces sp. NPDC001843 TaxID=3364617 RepID=UPI0036D17F67
MLTLAMNTLRTRRAAFTGSFLALFLGVTLLTMTGLTLAASLHAPRRAPERFAAAPVVVKGADTLRMPTPAGERVLALARPRPVPAPTVTRLKRLGTVVEDRSFPVGADSGPGDLVGHPWSTAAFAPYTLDAGRPPRAADEVVVSGGWARPGERVRTGHGTVRVVGTATAPHDFEHAVFYTDGRAAQLSPASTQLVVDATPSAVHEVVKATEATNGPEDAHGTDGTHLQVLTGDARRLADADPGRDREALTALNALFGTAGGVTAFVSVFVVASTFAFCVALRRREFGLLRAVGATAGQIRRTVLAEALTVGVLASAAGCAAGAYAAPWLAGRVVAEGLAPPWFTVGGSVWPYHLGFWTGLLVAVGGALAAAWRAGRTGPLQALREASVEGRAMTPGRWLCGTALLLTAAVTLCLVLVGDPGGLLHRKSYVSRPMLLITAVALLAPAVVRPLVRALVRLPGVTGLLVRQSAAAGVRRTAAVAAPVLVTVALAGSLLGATETLDATKAAEIRARTTATFVITPGTDASSGGPADGPTREPADRSTVGPTTGAGFDAATLRRLRAVPGARLTTISSSAVYVLEDGVALIRSEARAADPARLASTTRLPLAAGRTTDLDDDSIIVNQEWRRHTVGQLVRVRLGDGTPRALRIAAVMTTGTGDNGVYVTPRNAPGAPVDRVDVALAPGADAHTVATALRTAVRASGGRVLTREQWLRATGPGTDRTTRLGLLLVLGIALLYTAVSVANTAVLAASDRRRDLALLRLSGATRAQVLRLVAVEALAVVAVGTLLGLLVTALNLGALGAALHLLSAPAAPRLPWTALGTTTAACALLTVTASVVPAARTLRPHTTRTPRPRMA